MQGLWMVLGVALYVFGTFSLVVASWALPLYAGWSWWWAPVLVGAGMGGLWLGTWLDPVA